MKLCFHRASMKKYHDYLKKNNIMVKYFNYDIDYTSHLANNQITFYDPVDHDLINKINNSSKKLKFSVEMKETKIFVTTKEQLTNYHNKIFNKKFALTTSFYRWQRKELDIMYPIGKKYKLSYDDANREPFQTNPTDIFKPSKKNNKNIKK